MEQILTTQEELRDLRLECVKIAHEYSNGCPDCLIAIADSIFSYIMGFEIEEESEELDPNDN